MKSSTSSRTSPPHGVIPYTFLALATFLAVLPLLLHGPSCGHDLPFHMLNWLDAARQWRLGTLRPWWCFPGAWNTGEPRYIFYPPLSWVVGALLGLITGFAHASLAFTAVALFTSGVTMRHLLLRFVGAPAALLGACVYLAHPYMLFTAFERTAFAELLAAAWLPWLLYEALRDRIRPATLAMPVGLLWITNMPAAVLATYMLAIVLLLRTLRELRNHKPALRDTAIPSTLGFLWGLAASAFYLLPALVQHRYIEVNQALTGGMQPQEGMLFARIGEPLHDHVVHQASWIAIALLTTSALALAAWLLQRHHANRLTSMRNATLHRTHAAAQQRLVPTLAVLSAFVLFLFTPASLFVWRYTPELRFLQFPFRTLALQGGVTVLLVAFAIPARMRQRYTAPLALAAVAALAFSAHNHFAEFCDNEDAPTSLVNQYQRGEGFEPYDEYTPTDADNDLLHRGTPPAWTGPTASAAPTPEAATRVLTIASGPAGSAEGTNTLTFQAQPAATDHFLIVRQRRFPNWHTHLDGVEVQTDPLRDDDLLAIPISPGTHLLQLTYRWSLDQVAGVILSVTAILAIALFAKVPTKADRP